VTRRPPGRRGDPHPADHAGEFAGVAVSAPPGRAETRSDPALSPRGQAARDKIRSPRRGPVASRVRPDRSRYREWTPARLPPPDVDPDADGVVVLLLRVRRVGRDPQGARADVGGPAGVAVVSNGKLAEAHAVLRRWLGEEYDLDVLDIMLCALAGGRLGGAPPAGVLISGTGAPNTEPNT